MFALSPENTAIQRPQSFTPRAPIHVSTDCKHPAESPIPKQWWPCESRIHQTEQQMPADHQIDFRALRFCLAVFLSYKSCCPGALSAHCTMSIARLWQIETCNLNEFELYQRPNWWGHRRFKPSETRFPRNTYLYNIPPNESKDDEKKKLWQIEEVLFVRWYLTGGCTGAHDAKMPSPHWQFGHSGQYTSERLYMNKCHDLIQNQKGL